MILFLKSTLKRTVYNVYTTLNTMLKHGAFFRINIHNGLFIKQTWNCLKNEGIINFIKTCEFEDVVFNIYYKSQIYSSDHNKWSDE